MKGTTPGPLLQRNIFWLISIPLFVFIVYHSVLSFELVNWDDKRYVNETPMVKGLTWENVKEMFSNKVLLSYNPLVLVSFAIDFELSGLKPEWSHGVNLFIHILNALLVFACMKKLRFRVEFAGIISLLFAVHPLTTEAVAWIAGRKDVLYGFFFLLSWMFYINYFDSKKKHFYLLSLLFFLCSLFSKVQAITLPFVLIITDYILSDKIKWTSLINKIPFMIASFIFGLVAISGSTLIADKYSIPPTFIEKITYSIMGFGLYVQKIFLPFHQSAIYSFPVSDSFDFYRLMLTGAIVILLFGFTTYFTFKRSRMIAGGLAFYSVMMFIVLHIVAFNSALIYERFNYLASIGLFIAIVNLDQLIPSWRTHKFNVLAAVIVVFGIITSQRALVWSDPETMWSDVIEKNPKASEAYNNRGMVYLERGDNDKAFPDFNEGIKLRPGQPDAYNNRSVVYFNRKEYKKALADNDAVLKIDPKHKDGVTNRAVFFFNMNEFDSAIFYYNRATNLFPNNFTAHFFTGYSFYKKGNYHTAIEKYRKALSIYPSYADAYMHMSLAYVHLNKFDSVMYCVNAAESIAPQSSARKMASSEYIAKGTVLFDNGDIESAFIDYNLARDIMPTNAHAYYSLGGIYITRGNLPMARELWQKTLTMDPNHKEAKEWLDRIGR